MDFQSIPPAAQVPDKSYRYAFLSEYLASFLAHLQAETHGLQTLIDQCPDLGHERTYEIELYDAQSAAALVGKALGMFVERKQVEHVNKVGDREIVDCYLKLGVTEDK